MSRLIVKNLPKHITEKRLREVFSQFGELSDVNLRKKKKKSRKFCFIGFLETASAQKALKELNNTFLDTSRIEVTVAKTKDDPDLPRPWSKYSRTSSAYNNIHGITPEKSENPMHNPNQTLKEKKK